MGKSHRGMGLGSVQSSVPQQRKAGTPVLAKAGFVVEGSSDSDWRHRAACRPGLLPEDELAGDLFFPVGTTGPSLRWVEDAKAVCARCPVVADCLSFALDTNLGYGVWGGMSEEERASLKRRAARDRLKAKADAE